MGERGNDGRFLKGMRYHPETEFKKGEHWREHKPYWEKDWLENEYINKCRSSAEIAADFGVTDASILFWIRKHGIPRRTVSEARKIKKWGSVGEKNPMYGRRGDKSARWKGGCSPERQSFYSSSEWAAIVPKIWKRDNYQCQICGASHHGMHIHHIESFAIKAKRTDLNNLILLCAKCHRFVHSKRNVEGVLLNGPLRLERDPGTS